MTETEPDIPSSETTDVAADPSETSSVSHFQVWQNKVIPFMKAVTRGAANIVGSPLRLTIAFVRYLITHPVVGIFAIIGWFFFTAIVDPMNGDDNSDLNKSSFVNLVYSPFYGGDKRSGQSSIVVILADDQSLKMNYGRSDWPPSYSQQLLLFQTILEQQPAMLFADLYYEAPQRPTGPTEETITGDNLTIRAFSHRKDNEADPNIVDFASKITELREGTAKGIPFFIGPISDRPALRPLKEAFGRSRQGETYEVSLIVHEDRGIHYPWRGPQGDLSAAPRLFLEACNSPALLNTIEHCEDVDALKSANSIMTIEWGYGSLNQMRRVPNQVLVGQGEIVEIDKTKLKAWVPIGDECVIQSTPLSTSRTEATNAQVQTELAPSPHRNALLQSIRFFFQAMTPGINATDVQKQANCYYHDVITTRELLSLEPYQLSHFLRDKIVLIGADSQSLTDYFLVPVYDRVPGVIVHAMALDNLIERGREAPRKPGIVFGNMSRSELTSGILLTITIGLLALFNRFDMQRKPQSGHAFKGRVLRYTLLIVCVTVAGILLAYKVWFWPLGHVMEIGVTLIGTVLYLEFFARRGEGFDAKPINILKPDHDAEERAQ